MGKISRFDWDKVIEERKAFERTLVYWQGLKEKHPEGNTHFDENIAIARAKIEAFDFVLNQCMR